MTSSRVAGVLETYCTQSCPSSVHSLGGRIEFSTSSVCVCCFSPTGGSSFPFLAPFAFRFVSLVVLTKIGLLYFTSELCGGIIVVRAPDALVLPGGVGGRFGRRL